MFIKSFDHHHHHEHHYHQHHHHHEHRHHHHHHRRQQSIFGTVFSVCLALLLFVGDCGAKRKPPHIVFIMADDLGWNDVGWHNKQILTPNLDRLARKGVRLNSHYAQPTCTPSRNSLMTGMYPFHTRLQEAFDPSHRMFLPLEHRTIAERLKEAGYATHMVGKWHLGYCNERYTPMGRGFDSFFGFYIGSQNHYTHVKRDNINRMAEANWTLFSAGQLMMKSLFKVSASGNEMGKDFRFNSTAWTETEGEYSTHAFSRRATDIISRHDPDKPLFLYLPFQAVHTPLTVPKTYEKMYSHVRSPYRRVYAGMVSALDEAVGNITSALYQYGYMDNTLVVFTSDNGGMPYVGGNNLPLRGAKASLWEGGTRVPTFVFSPTLLRKRGYTSNRLMHISDWHPTFLHLAGLKPDRGLDGVNQWKTISMGSRSSRMEMVYNIEPSGKGALRIGYYKLLVGRPGPYNDWYPSMDYRRINRARFKGRRHDKHTLGSQLYRLYNLRADPSERHDISTERQDILHAMLSRFRQLESTKVERFTKVSDPGSDPNNYDGFWSPGWC